jgi:hypothetical protein
MARKRRKRKSKLEEWLEWISSAPFPISGIGLVLKRIPPPWNKCALLVVLIAIGILIIHPLVSPVRDFSLSLYYRVIPGPSVLVNFNNFTVKSASIGEKFEFWISENQNYDNAIQGKRTIPDGAITIPPDTKKPVYIRLPRKKIIHRLYRGGGYLRLRFKADGKEIEGEDDCSTVISEGLPLDIYKQWKSYPIALWFSEMEDSETNKDYIQDDVSKAIRVITNTLDVFEILAYEPNYEPNESDLNRILNIRVGCYSKKDPRNKELSLEIIDKGGKIKRAKIEELYEDPNKFESAYFVKDIIKRLREQILEGYPPRGIIKDLNREYVPFEKDAPRREICLNLGRETGIRRGDLFDILRLNQNTPIGCAKVTHAMEQESSAILIFDSKEVKKNCRVRYGKPR